MKLESGTLSVLGNAGKKFLVVLRMRKALNQIIPFTGMVEWYRLLEGAKIETYIDGSGRTNMLTDR